MLLLHDFFPSKNDVDVGTFKSSQQKQFENFFSGSVSQRCGSGSVPKCFGSGTMVLNPDPTFSLGDQSEEVGVRRFQNIKILFLILAICVNWWQFADTKSFVSNLDMALSLWFRRVCGFSLLKSSTVYLPFCLICVSRQTDISNSRIKNCHTRAITSACILAILSNCLCIFGTGPVLILQ